MCAQFLLYSLYTHSCAAKYNSNSILTPADDTTVVNKSYNSSGTKYRIEMENLVSWCQEDNLALNVSKTKQLVVDLRKQKWRTHPYPQQQELL